MLTRSKKMRRNTYTGEQASEETHLTTSAPKVTLSNSAEVLNLTEFPADNISEVWLNIFNKLNHRDKSEFSRTCPKWHGWVASKRYQFLFPYIAPIILPKGKALTHPTFLKCRQICKSWKDELDQLQFCYQPTINNFSSTDAIQNFMKKMGTHPANPFPTRTICLTQFEGRNQSILCREYWTNVNQLLTKFGKHVHVAKLDYAYQENELSIVEIAIIIRNFLLQLPNLRVLCIVGVVEREDQVLTNYFLENSLPRMEHLHTVEMHRLQTATMNAILKSCCVRSKIRRLKIDLTPNLNIFPNARIPQALFKFRNLEDLKVSGYRQDFERCFNLPRLKRLEFQFRRSRIGLEHFQALGRSSKSLTSLHIYGLKIESLDFLVQLTSLTRLKIEEFVVKQDAWERNIIEIPGYERHTHQTNIWLRIPTLQVIYVKKKMYKRPTFVRIEMENSFIRLIKV